MNWILGLYSFPVALLVIYLIGLRFQQSRHTSVSIFDIPVLLPKFQIKGALWLFIITLTFNSATIILMQSLVFNSTPLPAILTTNQHIASFFQKNTLMMMILFSWTCAWSSFFIGILASYRFLKPIYLLKEAFWAPTWEKPLTPRGSDDIKTIISDINAIKNQDWQNKQALLHALDRICRPAEKNKINEIKQMIQNLL